MHRSLFRRDYTAHKLEESELPANPFSLFKKWFAEASESGITDVNAMVLSTSTKNGIPSARIVLFKGFDEDENGFVFFTNYNSRKGKELSSNPNAALNFYWSSPERQINIRGKVVKVSEKISDEYFASRPRESQIGAWASEQSKKIESRKILERNAEFYRKKFEGKEIPRPAYWGGFSLKPDFIEFWQGRIGRLHDRFLYSKQKNGKWKIERLSP